MIIKHTFIIDSPPKQTPSTKLPDGAIAGNGDLALTWGGTCDRIRLYISKADFWKGTPYVAKGGGLAPFGIIEVLLPTILRRLTPLR